MKQEDKELLLKDLCARLPYGVKVKTNNIHILRLGTHTRVGEYVTDVTEPCKPYLFPMSSMTEEQFVELKVFADLTYEGNTLELIEWNDNCKTLEFWLEEIPSYELIKVFDWLNKNHFDYRGLIERGLAIDCTNLNIY